MITIFVSASQIEKVIEYLKPLKSLVSRTIIELLLHNISKIEELNNRITEIGFGDRQKISKNWKHYQLNILTLFESNSKELK